MAAPLVTVNKQPIIWQDKDIRFDISKNELQLRNGEVLLEHLQAVEDLKGNSGDKGKLLVTNLRLIWQSQSRPRVSLSIGLHTLTCISTRNVTSKLRSVCEALYILTKQNATRFEFVFVNLIPGSNRLITAVLAVYKAFTSSKLYRDLKIRSAIFSGGNLRLLPQETIYSKVGGVWNLSSDQGNLGTFYATNVRLVWHANMNDMFNISLPYIQIISLKVRESKFGMALVVETTEASGGYVLGFKVDPAERLQEVYKQLASLLLVHSASPLFGVDLQLGGSGSALNAAEVLTIPAEEDVEIIDSPDQFDVIASYMADEAHHQADQRPVYSPDLGLAIERLKPGYTLAELWEVVVPSN